ncbi:MAG: hypothetical protein QXH67_05395 [Candidatus Bathyarchaeia archaeon]
MSERLYKVQVPIFLQAIFIVLMLVEFFFSVPKPITDLNVSLRSFVPIVSASAIMLGIVLLTLSHLKRISSKGEDWYYSFIYLISLIITASLGIISVRDFRFQWIYNNMTAPIGVALYSLTAFYITSAAYRVFRARNFDATVLLVTAFIVLMMLIPVGAAILPPVVPIGEWLRSFPSSAGFRGMIIGTSLGIVGLGVRILVGRQREHLGIREERR